MVIKIIRQYNVCDTSPSLFLHFLYPLLTFFLHFYKNEEKMYRGKNVNALHNVKYWTLKI